MKKTTNSSPYQFEGRIPLSAVPHIARLLLGTSNHNTLLPMTLLCGAVTALLCNLICILPGESGILPINAITPVLGAPVIIYVIINQRKIQYFN